MTESEQFVDSGDEGKSPDEEYPNVPTPNDLTSGQYVDPAALEPEVPEE
jgi:hypothetical protein